MCELLAPDRKGIAQVCRITRERIVRGRTIVETMCSISSLTREQALPALSRAYWAIENRLHHVRDGSCREDQARNRVGNVPHVFVASRDTALTLLRRMGLKIAKGFE